MYILHAIQRHLEHLYSLDTELDVREFLVTRAQDLGEQGEQARQRGETLLVRDEGDSMELALYVDKARLERLEGEGHLHTENLQDFFLTTEGVSHFLHVVHRTRQEQTTSQTELELQGEVDKYLAVALRLNSARALGPAHRQTLKVVEKKLFEVPVSGELPAAELDMYQRAIGSARHYCRYLRQEFLRSRRIGPLLAELRTFYRLPLEQKLARIEAVC